MNRSSAIGAAIALSLLAQAFDARANGRYPTAGQIAVDPANPAHILVRTTYGLVTTTNGGAKWSWICEGAVGFNDFEDPMMGISKDGAMLAGMFTGLSVAHDGGCTWDLAGGGLKDRFVVDLSIERADPASAVLIVSNSVSKDVFSTQLWASPDNAKTWAQAGVDLPSSFLGLTVDTAPSDPSRVYVSGRFGSPDYLGALHRSNDRGKTWESLSIPGSDGFNLAYLAAVDPKDPNIVYVRLDGDKLDHLLLSKDGGATWMEVFTAPSLLGFALSPDGATVAIGSDQTAGTEKVGLWTAPSSTLAFTKVSDLGVRCLTWTGEGLFACADQPTAGFAAGVSTDAGKSFEPLLDVRKLCEPLACNYAPEPVGKNCGTLWGATKLTIAACPDGSGASSASSGSSSGSGGGGGGGSSGTSFSGCSCSAPGEASTGLLGGLSALALAVLLGRRRKRR